MKGGERAAAATRRPTAASRSLGDRWLDELFACIDRADPGGFAGYLAPGARFRFGNEPAVEGRNAIRDDRIYVDNSGLFPGR